MIVMKRSLAAGCAGVDNIVFLGNHRNVCLGIEKVTVEKLAVGVKLTTESNNVTLEL